jgi:hypothetical protein
MSSNFSSISKESKTDLSASATLASNNKDNNSLKMKLMKTYQTDQQVKYLHLQAEIELLLQQLQSIQQQKLSTQTPHTEEKSKETKSLVAV